MIGSGFRYNETYCNDRFMNEMNFDWDDLRLFLAVARRGGLAAAASQTKKSAPTLGRRMLALERKLGRELFVRLPREYVLTEDGERLLSDVSALEDRIAPLVQSGADQAVPVVKISAGSWVTHLLCTRVGEIVGDNRVRLRFMAADEDLDIGRREALIGIRNRRPTEIGLAGRRIGRIQFAIYARTPDVTTWARVMGKTPSAQWVAKAAREAETIEVTSPRNALDLALSGAARVALPTFIGDRTDGLQAVGAPIEELEHEQWLVTHHEDRFLPEVRSAIDRIHALLSDVIG